MRYLGIDPGQGGGIAWVDSLSHNAEAYKMPETERDTADLIEKLWSDGIDLAAIENVHSMPEQGVASSFKFGRNYGLLRGLLIAFKIPFLEVSPQTWQKKLQCLTHGDKNISKARAQQLFPRLKITHATADALLLAEYCRITNTLTGQIPEPVIADRQFDWSDL